MNLESQKVERYCRHTFFCPKCFATAECKSLQRTEVLPTDTEMDLKIMPPKIQVECKNCEFSMIEVDPSLLSRIVELNKLGYVTLGSCEGYHESIKSSEPKLDIHTSAECPCIRVFDDDDQTLYKTASALAGLPKFKDIKIELDDESSPTALVCIDCYTDSFDDPDKDVTLDELKMLKSEFSMFLTTLINELKAADEIQDGGEKE